MSTRQETVDKLADIIFKRTQLVQSDAEDLAWDLLATVEDNQEGVMHA